MDIIKKLKEMIASQDRKKLIENTVIVVIIGIVIIIAGQSIFNTGKKEQPVQKNSKTANSGELSQQRGAPADATEEKLKLLLSQIQGVGKAEVMITYESTAENIPAFDITKNRSSTKEKDSGGGTRDITEEEYSNALVYEDSADGGKSPVILKENAPKVRGVLIVADGAENVTVRERITNAVTVVLDVPAYKVQVAPRKK